MNTLLAFWFLFLISFWSPAQENEQQSPILLIYDASGSMWAAMEGKTRVEIAREVLSSTVSNLPESQQIGLIAYGHRQKGDCKDVEYLVDLSNSDKTEVITTIQKIMPLGMTPLAYSASLAVEDLKKSGKKATIILVTDGIESCDGDLCKVISDAKATGIDFKLHIIGFGLKDEETAPLKCASLAGDGQYFDAKDTQGLIGSLEQATTETVDRPAGNYGIKVTLNGEPIDALVTAFEAGTQNKVSIKRTYRDSVLVALPQGKHDLMITALENTDLKPILISDVSADPNAITYRHVSFDGGKMLWTVSNNGELWDASVTVFEAGTKTGAAVGRTYNRPKEYELSPGLYDVRILALIISGEKEYLVKNIEVKPGETLELAHDFKTGIAKIGAVHGSDLVDATVSIRLAATKENVAGMRTYTAASSNPREFILTPGDYEVTVIAVPKEYAGKKEVFQMKIVAGETFEKTINF
ncbi:hypothetical protein GCM10009119_00780 [Algoriphagus jejuensis]|uniref:VWFA domain-containing protein n=1 Tax=Algoriphagus jejuensis TaxID=419934 RepID=A0ABP3Y8K4_9BACT